MISEVVQTEEFKKKADRVFSLSMGDGIKWGLGTTAIVGAATAALTLKNKRFNAATNMSSRMAIPVMAGLFGFAVNFERTMVFAQRYPDKYGLTDYISTGKVHASNMPFHHSMLNYIYDHPYQLIGALGAPWFAWILRHELSMRHLTLSQKIMHTRVFAQAGILSVLLSTMAFREYMHKHGRFEEPSEKP